MVTFPDEKLAFSERLIQSLKRSKKHVSTPTELALQFNLRHKNDPITTAAAHKWMTGKALPTPDKVETLAAWLNVPVQWLRFGIPEVKSVKPSKASGKNAVTIPPNASEMKLLQQIRNLPESRRQLVVELIEQFALDQEMWQN